ncbi:MAG: hypothetical protein HDQ88_04395 [Clostridia bacterium]|nr:hypothetical protein [Clostridia bacterium]
MGKMTQEVNQKRHDGKTGRVTNFMGGNSYELDPLETLKIVTSSSIFGEPAYYRDGQFSDMRIKDGTYRIHDLCAEGVVRSLDKYAGLKTSDLMERAIDDALSYDYAGVLDWAGSLRTVFNMRLNPQVIMVRAATHPDRVRFTDKHPGKFHEANMAVMTRADDVVNQLTYYLFRHGNKSAVPGILKKSWAKKVESLTRYEISKYKNHGIGLIDTVRICHANNGDIDELMRTGTVKVEDDQKTWEALRAGGMSWADIAEQIRIPHMALLRNLRGIFTETPDEDLCERLMEQLVNGVRGGRQFPFRYMSALRAVEKSDVDPNLKASISNGLNMCLDRSCMNLPRLPGRSAFLSDNSGSAWGTFNSEYGSVTIADIDNLSATIGAVNSDEGYVFAFGDKLIRYDVRSQVGILSKAREISRDASALVGQSTENGIWLFFEQAICTREHWDNIFIYSDQQAGHGGLYGTDDGIGQWGVRVGGSSCFGQRYIDVVKLVSMYREKVNPKVNVYCVQTVGYDNMLVPENLYRTSILYGWTGRELVYADAINKFWDEHDSKA